MRQKITISPFQAEYQRDIDSMMERISLEFEEPIFTKKSKKIAEIFQEINNKFWVAKNDHIVVGTIGLTRLSNNNIALKSMFVDKMFRSQGVSILLLDNLLSWTIQNDCKQIYLGTMTQFLAGQKFYEKNGFKKCNETELPNDFIRNKLDTIFYVKHLD